MSSAFVSESISTFYNQTLKEQINLQIVLNIMSGNSEQNGSYR